jgi:hypothetical protein
MVFYARRTLTNAKAEARLQAHRAEILARFLNVAGGSGCRSAGPVRATEKSIGDTTKRP